MFKEKNIYIISPHIDDSFFSLWYLINNLYNKWYKIKIVNVFTQTNFLQNWLENNAWLLRANEEKQLSIKYKNIDFINLDFKDAIIRWYNRKEDIFSLRNLLDDVSLIYNIKEKIKTKITENHYILFLPIWFWNHVDHLLISNNIKIWNKIYYYEDLPYVSRDNKNDYALLKIKNMNKVKFDFILNEDKIQHLNNIKCYKSQLTEKINNEIFNYLNKNNLWIWKENIY